MKLTWKGFVLVMLIAIIILVPTLIMILLRHNENSQPISQALSVPEKTHTLNYDDSVLLNRLGNRLRNLCETLDIKHFVVWGHTIRDNGNTHTHAYIHEAFVRAALHIGLDTHWVPQQCYKHRQKTCPIVYDGPVDHCLFLTEGQVVEGIPQSKLSWYILHNVEDTLSNIPENRKLTMQFYHQSCTNYSFAYFDEFQRLDVEHRTVYMPWATNLLPHEFKPPNPDPPSKKEVCVVGQHGKQYAEKIHQFMRGCSSDTKLNHRVASVPQEEMIKLISESWCAPALVNQWQKDHGYIPCRIMKNISYGQVPVTNAAEAHYMLHFNTVYHADESRLGKIFTENADAHDLNKLRDRAFQLVQQRHTYLNRMELLLSAFLIFQNAEPEQLWCAPKNSTQKLKVVHLTCHTGCIRHINFVASELHWDVTHLNMLQLHSCKVYNMTRTRSMEYWKLYSDQLNQADVVICSDTAPLSRMILENLDDFNGHLLIWVCNRFNYAHHDKSQNEPPKDAPFPDQGWYDLITSASRNYAHKVRVVSYTKLERIYSTNLGVFWEGPFSDTVLKPVGNKIQTAPEHSDLPQHILKNKANYVFIPPYLNDEKLINFEYLDHHNIKYYRGRYRGPEDLRGFKAILHIPYAPSNLALFENLTRGIVYYIPSQSFMKRLLEQHGWFSGGVSNFSTSEWYDPKMQHLFVYFDSWDDFRQKLDRNAHEPLIAETQEWARRATQNSLCQWNILTQHWW